MNSAFLKEVLAALLRWLLTSVSSYLIAQGALTEQQTGILIAGLAGLICALLLSLYHKYKQQVRLFLALDMPGGATLADLAAWEKDPQKGAN